MFALPSPPRPVKALAEEAKFAFNGFALFAPLTNP